MICRSLHFTLSLFSISSSQNVQSECGQGQATPTDVMSLSSSSINSTEMAQTNQKQEDVQSPAPPIVATDPPVCDIITCCASSRVGGAKTVITTDPGINASLVPSSTNAEQGGGECLLAPPSGRSVNSRNQIPGLLLQVSAPLMRR